MLSSARLRSSSGYLFCVAVILLADGQQAALVGDGPGGALPPLFTTALAAFRVAESQALNTSDGT